MSLTEIRPYFRGRLNALRYKEWADGFDFQNIPSTLLDKSYHIDANEGLVDELGNLDFGLTVTARIRVFTKGYRNISEGIDLTLERVEEIVRSVMDPVFRLNGDCGLKTCDFSGFRIEPISLDNNNITVATLDFRCLVYVDIRNQP